jgi:hypothetical protein
MPHELYYGAAVAAVMVGESTKAAQYRWSLEKIIADFRSRPWMPQEHVKRLDKGLSWLNAHIPDHPESGP